MIVHRQFSSNVEIEFCVSWPTNEVLDTQTCRLLHCSAVSQG